MAGGCIEATNDFLCSSTFSIRSLKNLSLLHAPVLYITKAMIAKIIHTIMIPTIIGQVSLRRLVWPLSVDSNNEIASIVEPSMGANTKKVDLE